MNNKLEIRNISSEFSFDEESRHIHGLAIATESLSELITDKQERYYEVISRDAVNMQFIQSQDIKLYLNHDMSQGTYGRSKFGEGTLNFTITERGLEFDIELPNTAFGEALVEGIRRGDFDACSFAFIPDKVQWVRDANNTLIRRIESFALIDEISVLSCLPAYAATNVSTRQLEEFITEEKEQERKYEESLTKLDDISEQLNGLYCKYLDIAY